MRLLVVTNLYPPQELGGYGRCIADFVWGLQRLGHRVQVVCSDAPYLGSGGAGPSGEPVDRRLRLKGSFEHGVQHLTDWSAIQAVDHANVGLLRHWFAQGPWDGILLGNLDLLGPELLQVLLEPRWPVAHHVGFVSPPFDLSHWPAVSHYHLVAASRSVRSSLVSAGFPVHEAPVVYPGARVELFGSQATGRPPLPLPDGTERRPLRICFAGILMASKGAHTVVEALALLHRQGIVAELMIAGCHFQPAYVAKMEEFVRGNRLEQHVSWLGALSRDQLARCFALNHVAVFASIYPEAFGIVAAEAMASGLLLFSSAVGGAAELFEDGVSGISFEAGNATHLASRLLGYMGNTQAMSHVAAAGQRRVRDAFGLEVSASAIEAIFRCA